MSRGERDPSSVLVTGRQRRRDRGAAESYIALRKQAAQQGVTVSDLARDLVRRAQSH